ncbi:MAG: GNAT family N-acetyltransferase [Sphingomonadales bacterium]|nr:GNAT family N-acetyltransferase [Sphingomonadales bacterium]
MTAHPLSQILAESDMVLQPYDSEYREALRAAYALDQKIWEIYPHSMVGEHFELSMRHFEAHYADGNWAGFLVLVAGQVAGLSNYINADAGNKVLEIGGTYISPEFRGTGVNGKMKRLMINHAFANGYRRIEFRVDARNKRSQAAVLKLGAVQEGILRQNRITWTGYVRDTVIFGLLKDEWRGSAS